mmetsp:Transcript_47602/g.86028  ORF Transcript_47602/g.86028 Transcript_47602/m.86028 type:complete len:507 (-) Transcript_47602:83-1603(-)
MMHWPTIGWALALLWTAAVPAVGLSVALQSKSQSANAASNRTRTAALLQRSFGNSSEDPRVPAELGAGANSAVPDTDSPLKPRMGQPRLFFLFLVYAKINNEEVWDRFFDSAVQGVDYRALVHCKSESGCRKNIRSQHRFEIIPSVETTYCFNLVGGMNALLKRALSYSGHQESQFDKFIFLSDSTLPVKPFSMVKQRLIAQRESSNFCIFPRNEWAEISSKSAFLPGHEHAVRAAVKHHQWIILSRAHAQNVMKHALANRDLMRDFKLNHAGRNQGCLDEFWHFATLFGTVELLQRDGPVYLQGFSGSPLLTSNYEPQGQCDTFVQWMPRAAGVANNLTRFAQDLQSDLGVDMSPATEGRPAKLHRFSKQSLMRFRDSWFLFARKVEDDAKIAGCGRLVDAFEKLVFSVPSQGMTSEPSWRGEGEWRDTRNAPVTISSADGTLALKGSGSGMSAKGAYCNDNIEVAFSNGYRASATLGQDGLELKWNTGVSWHRSARAVLRSSTK